jgi:hypothetical protein
MCSPNAQGHYLLDSATGLALRVCARYRDMKVHAWRLARSKLRGGSLSPSRPTIPETIRRLLIVANALGPVHKNVDWAVSEVEISE